MFSDVVEYKVRMTEGDEGEKKLIALSWRAFHAFPVCPKAYFVYADGIVVGSSL